MNLLEKERPEWKIVVLLNGYQKKTQKTSHKEIEMANKLMKEYFSTTK
jgi:phage-related protein